MASSKFLIVLSSAVTINLGLTLPRRLNKYPPHNKK